MVHQFAYGWITPALAYALSFVGSLLGLVATVRARSAQHNGQRARWLALAACALGGTGIWTMHFLAMAGFAVDGTTIRYDVPITVASWLTAVIVVGVGLFVVGFGRPSAWKVIPAGVLTGAGVAGMHYSGMSAMRLGGHIVYDRRYVIASVVIAIVAAIVALWFTVTVHRPVALFGSAALMALAVSSMHYTGMYAVHVHTSGDSSTVSGADPTAFLVPILVLALVMIVALFYALLAVPGRSDRELQEELRARIDGTHPDTRPARYSPTAPVAGPGTGFHPSDPWTGSRTTGSGGGFGPGVGFVPSDPGRGAFGSGRSGFAGEPSNVIGEAWPAHPAAGEPAFFPEEPPRQRPYTIG